MEENVDNLNNELPKKPFPVWLAILIILLIAGAITAFGLWYKNRKSNESTTSSTTSNSESRDKSASTTDWQTYKSTSQGFSIIIPPTWKQTESGVEGRISFSRSDVPEGDAPATTPTTFANIWSEANSNNQTIDAAANEIKSLIQNSPIKNFKLVSEENININGVAGKKIVMSYTDNQTGLSHVSGFACAINNGKIWKINFIVSAQSLTEAQTVWNQDSYLFDKMISAFIFL